MEQKNRSSYFDRLPWEIKAEIERMAYLPAWQIKMAAVNAEIKALVEKCEPASVDYENIFSRRRIPTAFWEFAGNHRRNYKFITIKTIPVLVNSDRKNIRFGRYVPVRYRNENTAMPRSGKIFSWPDFSHDDSDLTGKSEMTAKFISNPKKAKRYTAYLNGYIPPKSTAVDFTAYINYSKALREVTIAQNNVPQNKIASSMYDSDVNKARQKEKKMQEYIVDRGCYVLPSWGEERLNWTGTNDPHSFVLYQDVPSGPYAVVDNYKWRRVQAPVMLRKSVSKSFDGSFKQYLSVEVRGIRTPKTIKNNTTLCDGLRGVINLVLWEV